VKLLQILDEFLKCVLVTGAGNDAMKSVEVKNYPARYLYEGVLDNMMVAGAVDINSRRGSFSQIFVNPDVRYPVAITHAPGVALIVPYSTNAGQEDKLDSYGKASGTSLGKSLGEVEAD
jgi:hypothetical protein